MPGSCESDSNSSPSLISSLRNFRFTNRTKRYQPEAQSSPSTSESSHTIKDSSVPPTPDSTSSKDPVNGTASKNCQHNSSINNQFSPASISSSTSKPPQPYDPFCYRKYDSITTSNILFPCILTKIQQILKIKVSGHNTELELKLTNEELIKVKDIILQDSSISQKWKSHVTHEEHSFNSSGEKVLKINRGYLTELLRLVRNVYKNNLTAPAEEKPDVQRSVRTYSRLKKESPKTLQSANPNKVVAVNDPPDLSHSEAKQPKGIMDEYEVFCGKEQNLRRLLDAFPGADIMEAQDILARCDWNFNKAVGVAQKQPLRCAKKRALSTSSDSTNSQQNLGQSSTPQPVAVSKPSTSSTAEEIILDSSDDEDAIQPKIPNNKSKNTSLENNSAAPPSKRQRMRISSSETDDERSFTPPSRNASLSAKSSNASISRKLSSQSLSVTPSNESPSVKSSNSSLSVIHSNAAKSVKPANVSVSKSVNASVSVKPANASVSVKPASASVSVKPASASVSVKPASAAVSVKSTNASVSVKSTNAPVSVKSTNASLSVTSSNAVQKPSSSQQQSVNSSNEQTFSMSKSMTIKPVSSSSTNIALPVKSVSSTSSIPNLPKGLVLIQVGDLSPKKVVTENRTAEASNNSVKSSASITSQQLDVGNIPSFSKVAIPDSNEKPAQLVRIKSSNGVSKKTKDSSSFTTNSTSLSVTPVGKGVSITPVASSSSANDDSASTSKSTNHSSKSRNAKGKPKKYTFEDEDDDEYGNDIIYDSEDSDFEEENLTSAHSAVLKFFQESSPEELMCVPGCSKKKVDSIMNLRPFINWADLVAKLGTDKYLSTDLLNGSKKVLDMRTAINKLMTKCQQISLDMEDLVENLKENKESCSGYVNKQPDLLNDRMHLTSYQMLGLNWLLLMHNQEVNGILADEMGLGKTVQAIAFLAYLKEVSMSGPHLIVVPGSVLDNWKQEFKAWWPDVSLICYHGNQDSRRELRMQILNDEVDEFDIMVTTYNMVTSSAEDRGFFKRLEFHYVVFDEAHMLKNMASQRYQHLMRIKAPRRLLLTGTPLQNNLVELMSLLIFAMPHMFSGKTEHIKQMFSSVSKTEGNKNTYEKDRIDHAKRIMKPFVLRRLKKDVLQDLPAKHDDTKLCPMTEDQSHKYDGLVETFSAEVLNKDEKDSSSTRVGMMMQLRRAANHPLLLRHFYNDNKLLKMSKAILKEPTHSQSDPNLVFEDMSVMSDFELYKLCKTYKSLKSYVLPVEDILNSGKFNVLDSLLPSLIEEGHRILLFSQFTMVLDIVEEYMNIKEYKFLRLDGQVPVPERQQLIDEFNTDPSIFVFLLSTRAGGLGINLTAADTVILHDIDFNPYNDKQAEDRCHRVGQTKDVNVIRLISENTIEEGILQRAKEKLKLERDITEEDETEENDVASVAKLLRDALGLKSTKS